MASKGATYELAVLLSLKDKLSKGLDQSIAKLKVLGAATERGKQREVSATERAARQVERITGQTTRQAEQQVRFRERIVTQSASRSATAQIREQRRASNEMIRLIDKTRRSDGLSGGRSGTRYGASGGFGSSVAGGAIGAGLGGGVAAGAVGAGLLATFVKGVQTAGNYEAAMLDLKSAYQEANVAGSLSAGAQAKNLRELSGLATKLGSDLQGSTQDYVGILTSLKKAGVETETVLGGAGKAAAYLANVTGAVTSGYANEQAKELGQFGKMFQLKPKDFVRSVDLFSGLKDRFDISSSEIVESSKYFLPSATALKMTGAGGAEETSKLFAALKRYGGMEGSQAGTSATSFFQQYIKHGDKRAKLKKQTGLDIDLFDKKGSFLGLEKAFGELSKLRKFSSEQRLDILNDIFGEQGGKVANTMAEAGVEGWKNISAEAGKAVAVNEKIIAQMATFNAKVESLTGSVSNLGATAFTPVIDRLGQIADKTNVVVTALQGFAKSHPRVSSLTTDLIGMGGAALTVSTGVGLLGRVLGGLPSRKSSRIAVDGMGRFGKDVGRAKGMLGGLPASVKIGIGFFAVDALSQTMMDLYNIQKERNKQNIGQDKTGKTDSKLIVSKHNRGIADKDDYVTAAGRGLESINRGGEFVNALDPSRQGWWDRMLNGGQNPYTNPSSSGFHLGKNPTQSDREAAAAGIVRQRFPAIGLPEAKNELLNLVKGWKLPADSQAAAVRVIEQASKDASKGLFLLSGPTKENADAMSKLVRPTENAGNALTSLVNRLDRLQVGGPVIGEVWGRDGGGSTTSGGGSGPTPLAPSSNLNRGAQPTHSMNAPRMISSARGGGGVRIDNLNVNLPPGVATDDPDELARKVGVAVRQELAQLDFNQMIDDRTDFRVGNILERG